MLVTNADEKCVGDNHKMLVTVLAILVSTIDYLFTITFGIKLVLPTFKRCHKHRDLVTNIPVVNAITKNN